MANLSEHNHCLKNKYLQWINEWWYQSSIYIHLAYLLRSLMYIYQNVIVTDEYSYETYIVINIKIQYTILLICWID